MYIYNVHLPFLKSNWLTDELADHFTGNSQVFGLMIPQWSYKDARRSSSSLWLDEPQNVHCQGMI